ncbi:MAG TPA: glycosyltransferase family 2 protein [Kiritimatiellia bacterium]|nr:glycosyltransferase family 2 protein [Kiritimatiellia bacterium]
MIQAPPPVSPGCCLIIPAFMEEGTVGRVVAKAKDHVDLVLVVDDGSTDRTGEEASEAGAEVLRIERNGGKGAALRAGFRHVQNRMFEVILTMDADGQHDPADLPSFLDAYVRTGIPVLVGNRLWDRGHIPPVRRWTNIFMSRLLCRIMGTYLPDTQCGFRLYRADLLPYISTGSQRFAMESEILLQLGYRGYRMDNIRIRAIYEGHKSEIKPIKDTYRFLVMLARFHRLIRSGVRQRSAAGTGGS